MGKISGFSRGWVVLLVLWAGVSVTVHAAPASDAPCSEFISFYQEESSKKEKAAAAAFALWEERREANRQVAESIAANLNGFLELLKPDKKAVSVELYPWVITPEGQIAQRDAWTESVQSKLQATYSTFNYSECADGQKMAKEPEVFEWTEGKAPFVSQVKEEATRVVCKGGKFGLNKDRPIRSKRLSISTVKINTPHVGAKDFEEAPKIQAYDLLRVCEMDSRQGDSREYCFKEKVPALRSLKKVSVDEVLDQLAPSKPLRSHEIWAQLIESAPPAVKVRCQDKFEAASKAKGLVPSQGVSSIVKKSVMPELEAEPAPKAKSGFISPEEPFKAGKAYH